MKSILHYPLTYLISGAICLGLSIDVSLPLFKGMYLVGGVWLLIEANNCFSNKKAGVCL